MDQKPLEWVAGSLLKYYNKIVSRVGGYAPVSVVLAR